MVLGAFGDVKTSSSSVDDLLETGIYYYNGDGIQHGLPINYGTLIVVKSYYNASTQLFIGMDNGLTNIYGRTKLMNASWSGWDRLDNFGCSTPSALAELLGGSVPVFYGNDGPQNGMPTSFGLYYHNEGRYSGERMLFEYYASLGTGNIAEKLWMRTTIGSGSPTEWRMIPLYPTLSDLASALGVEEYIGETGTTEANVRSQAVILPGYGIYKITDVPSKPGYGSRTTATRGRVLRGRRNQLTA